MSQPQLINGQLCFNCTDVDRARRDLNPSRTQKAKLLGVDPSQIQPDGQVKPKPGIQNALSAAPVTPAGASDFGQPLDTGPRGRQINITA